MTVESYIRALPKVELFLQLEGAVPRETMLMFADQNEMQDSVKRFDRWLDLYEKPDFKKLDDLTEMLRSWLQYSDDLTRAIYDVGVVLSKQNVRYAEIGVNPLSFVSNDLTFEAFINALNDGRDRAERAWGVQMRWIMLIPRNDPRRADEVARWATSHTAEKGGVVGLALVGQRGNKPVSLDQFERAFRTAEKKALARAAYLSEKDDVDEAIDLLGLEAVVDGWGLNESPETLAAMQNHDVLLCIGAARALAYGRVKDITKYPYQTLYDSGVTLVISSDMPALFRSQISDEYLAILQADGLTIEQMETLTRNAFQRCHLPEEEKEALLMMLDVELDVLRAEHIDAEDSPAQG
jgi:adenosine deaminase